MEGWSKSLVFDRYISDLEEKNAPMASNSCKSPIPPVSASNQTGLWYIYPTVFSGERGEDSQRWLSDFQRVARYNKWDDSMCLANVIFYLTGTAKCWFENFEEILNS
ncbi:hypothetical protein LAZ67_18001275 [Cordylochernes scorpioides]|uniref:Retrotransposon gag domain-containing protein n=1 Tax=Cordylochernes scorpioides TaxID=51811 RepID=A0ABY6LJV3_9ARAC|nr:hypothetical protein LAZ67_18001275 [Cordylochernes scorpioides]